MVVGDREHVSALKCGICIQFRERLMSLRNYNPAFINGSKNTRTSSFKEHAETEMHKVSMALYKKQHSENICDYAPITRAILQPSMDEATRQRLKRKFEIAYMVVKENLAFKKMKPLYDMEESHGVDIGRSYRNDHGCALFVESIATDLQEKLKGRINKARLFSLLIDSSTDSGNIDDELFLVLYFDPYSQDGVSVVHVRDRFFAVRQLTCGTGEGLYACVKNTLAYMGIPPVEWKNKLIGLGCDGTNANMGSAGGLKRFLKEDIPWLMVSWCLAHRLELSVKDALKGTFFKEIDELLLQVYYVYEKSPKKCHELKGIVDNLKQCLTDTEMPKQGGNRPLRACGTRFIAHKVAALERLIDRYGAYLNHLMMLSQDKTVKPVDREKLKGYILRWRKSKILLGCAFFYDVLKPLGMLSKVLQEDELCLVRAIEAFFKTKKVLGEAKMKTFEDIPAVKKVLTRIQQKEVPVVSTTQTVYSYQGADLVLHSEALSFLKKNYKVWLSAVDKCLVNRLKAQEEELLIFTHAMTILATQGWERTATPSFGYASLEEICDWFAIPLEKAGIDSSAVQEEWDDMVEYNLPEIFDQQVKEKMTMLAILCLS